MRGYTDSGADTPYNNLPHDDNLQTGGDSWRGGAPTLPRFCRFVGDGHDVAGPALHALARRRGGAQAARAALAEHRHLRRERLAGRRAFPHDRREAPFSARRPRALELPRDQPPHLRNGTGQARRLVFLPGRPQPPGRTAGPCLLPPALLRRRHVLRRSKRRDPLPEHPHAQGCPSGGVRGPLSARGRAVRERPWHYRELSYRALLPVQRRQERRRSSRRGPPPSVAAPACGGRGPEARDDAADRIEAAGDRAHPPLLQTPGRARLVAAALILRRMVGRIDISLAGLL